MSWLADGSPGKLGDLEIWIDEAALGMAGDFSPAVIVRAGPAGHNPWLGAVISFRQHPGLTAPPLYEVIMRCWSRSNGGRPYYVARWPD